MGFMFIYNLAVYSQEGKSNTNPTQKIKGIVIDADSKKPLAKATLTLTNGERVTLSDESGYFTFSQVPVGRHSLDISMLGYENKVIGEIVVSSGKEAYLNISLTEKISSLNEIVIKASKNRVKPNNEFATVSARSFSVEDTKRYPASAFDPGRMAQNFAGVSNNGDGSNEIVVRGNSPSGVLWRLEGIEIPSPNHFGSLGSTGGAISMLSSSTLGNSDFYTGAFPAEFGNATAGAFDLTFRNGNNEKNEYSFMLGLLGIEAAAEGPIGKKGQSSYLINYRYSTVALVSSFLNLGGVNPNYQDLSFKFNFPTCKAGTFSFFGLGGMNKAVKDPAKDSSRWTDDDPNFVLDAPGKIGIAGLSHQYFLNKKSYIKTIIAISGQYASSIVDTLNPSDKYERVQVGNEENIDIAYRASVLYNNKINGRSTLRIGIIGSRLSFDYNNRYYDNIDKVWIQSLAAEGSSIYLQAYAQWKYRISNCLTLNTGLHSSYLGLNKTKSIEPRAALSFKASKGQTITIAAGLHERPEHLYTYYVDNQSPDSTSSYPNKDLEMNKAMHLVLGYEKIFPNNLRFKTEVYYQYLYDIPVEMKNYSYFSMLNSSSFYELVDIGPLTSTGTGNNYGVDISLEKSFNKNYFFLATGSIFSSKYTNYDNKEFNTRYNRNYQLNLVAGKEWKRKSKNIWGLNGKLLTSGGLRDSEIDLDASKARGKVIYKTDRYYTEQAKAYFRFDIGISYKRNLKHSTHTLMFDIQNLTGYKNVYTTYYDNKSGSVKTAYQTGLFPFLNYRIEF